MTVVEGALGVGPGWPPDGERRRVTLSVRAPYPLSVDGKRIEAIADRVKIDRRGEFRVVIEPGYWCFRTEAEGRKVSERVLEVPETDGETVRYETLVEVDPDTLIPLDPTPLGFQEQVAKAIDAPEGEPAEAVKRVVDELPVKEQNLPERLSPDGLSNTYVTVAVPFVPAALHDALGSFAVCIIGDSTGNETSEWVHLTAQKTADLFPAFEVRHHRWDDTNQRMPRPIIVRPGPNGERRMTFAGVAFQAPFYTAPAVQGDIDVRARVRPTSWASGAEQVIVCQFPEAAENRRAWSFALSPSGSLQLQWSTDGTALQTAVTSGAWTRASEGPLWVRATLDVDNGAGGHTVTFYQSTDGETWTQINTPTTRAGATSLFNSTGAYQIAGRGNAAAVFAGDFFEVDVRAGIGDAPTVAGLPALPELWNANPQAPSPTGSPIVTFVNGSHPGADVAYLSDAARLGKMTPNYGQRIVILSSSHNEMSIHGAQLLTRIKALVTSLGVRLPDVPFSLVTQNPRIAPAARIVEQAQRRVEYLTWAQAHGWVAIDTYAKFESDPRGVAALVGTDGFHPNAEGSKVWAAEAQRRLGITA